MDGEMGLAPRAKQESLCFYRCATTPNFDQDQKWAHCLEPKKVKGTAHNLCPPPSSSPVYQQIPHTLRIWEILGLAPFLPQKLRGRVLERNSLILQMNKLRLRNLESQCPLTDRCR